jgi:hypothetical protein
MEEIRPGIERLAGAIKEVGVTHLTKPNGKY